MTDEIEVIETVWIAMPDGARLAARLWLPPEAKAGKVPTILEYIPYRRRDRTRLRDESMHPRFAAAGYAALRVDMRGSGDSEGVMHDEYLEQEIQDGCDVIAWIAEQPWSDGTVGMFGKSWGAYTSFQVAARRPPALKAIAPVMGTDDRWAECIHFSGGCLMTDNFWWGAIMQLYNAMPPDPEIVGLDRWKEMWKERLEAMTFWPKQWLEHQTRDALWTHGSICENYGDIAVPVYFFGGWADLFRDTPFRIAENLKVPFKVLMGPWAHLYPHEGVPGPQVDFLDEVIRWWDHWLKGKDSGLLDEPPLRFFLQDGIAPAGFHAERAGAWVEEARWPSPNVSTKSLWLNAGTLSESADTSGSDLFVTSPQSYGAAAGDMCSFAIPGDMPADCRLDGEGALPFRSTPLEAPLTLLGQPSVRLRVSSDQPQAFVAALLVDEAPDGAQTLITRGFFNLMHREGPTQVVPMTPEEPVDVDVALHGIGYRVSAGHRLLLKLSSAYWPLLWPSPTPVTLTLAPGRSRLDLPLRQATPEAPAPRPFPAPTEAQARRFTKVREGSLERGWHYDATTGTLRNQVTIDGGVFGPVGRIRLDDIGTELGDVSDRVYEIGSGPLSARAVMTQTADFERGDWAPRIEAFAEMTATATHFRLNARVQCWDGDEAVHQVTWEHEIPRNGM